MKYKDFLDKNNKYDNFKPVLEIGNKITNNFSIVFNSVSTYDKLLKLMEEMSVVIKRLNTIKWPMSDMKVGTTPDKDNKSKFTYLS